MFSHVGYNRHHISKDWSVGEILIQGTLDLSQGFFPKYPAVPL